MNTIKKTLSLPVEIIALVEKYKEEHYLPNFTAALVQMVLKVSKEENK